MSTAAIICEYDPFHNGHEYLIRTARDITGCDGILCIMSGNYVQRGTPAIYDKYFRAECALRAGADLVLEIPAMFSSSSAREFASCAVRIAMNSGIVDYLVFGVEDEISSDDLEEEASLSENPEKSEKIRSLLASGATYPAAITSAGLSKEKLSSNNILAVEYLKALNSLHSSILPVPVKRQGDGYSLPVPTGSRYASATALRELIGSGKEISAFVPSYALPGKMPFVHPDMMTSLLQARLMDQDDLTCYLDVSKEIAGRLMKRRNHIMTFSERVDDTKTKQYTRTRIQRALLHIALRIRKEDFERTKTDGYVSCLRVLGLRKGSPVASALKKKASLPVAARTAPYRDALKNEIYCDQLYYSLTGSKGEFERSPVIL